jgi:hypothetical protein
MQPKCNNIIRIKGLKLQLELGKKKNVNKEDHRPADHEASKWALCQDSKNECQNIMKEPVTP